MKTKIPKVFEIICPVDEGALEPKFTHSKSNLDLDRASNQKGYIGTELKWMQ